MAGLEVQEIERGLWRWAAAHPEWDPDPAPTTGWIEQVASVYCELPGAILLVDPVCRPTRLTQRGCGPPSTATSSAWAARSAWSRRVHWHRRGADAVVDRYGALDGVVPDGARTIPSAIPSERRPMPCPVTARSCSGTS